MYTRERMSERERQREERERKRSRLTLRFFPLQVYDLV